VSGPPVLSPGDNSSRISAIRLLSSAILKGFGKVSVAMSWAR
jgi:hypothetical protein